MPSGISSSIAVFDFDGTMTSGDSLLPFLLHAVGPARFSRHMLMLLPTLTGYALGFIRNDIAKEIVLARFLRGRQFEALRASALEFARQKLPAMIRDESLKRLQWHKQKGHQCILLSASLELYLEPWAAQAGFDRAIGSRLETGADGRITGRLAGANCYGAEKIERLKALIGPLERYLIYAYGDSRGDKELLALANYPYYRIMPAEPS